MQVVLISGLSGSGKSVALKVLEDAGYYAIDNLPANLLPHLVRELELEGYQRAAVAVDVRTGASIAAVPRLIEELRPTVDDLRVLFLDARDDTLIARFSETRRSHPLAADDVSLAEAIERERDLLEPVAELGHRIDTSDLQANTLRTWIKDVMGIEPSAGLTLMFQSFGFKYGIPLDADLVFDVRCLPNPHYEKALRPLTGRDQPVIEFLERIPEVGRMCLDITHFLANWLPAYERDNRSYLTVAIGCTGGQHRSVYIAEWLGQHFEDTMRVLVRHRSSARRGIDHGPTSARL